MANSKGTAGEDIGRPGPWGEDRYQTPGESIDKSVRTPPGTVPGERPDVSTPVTQEDYGKGKDEEAPGGDAG